MALAPETTVDEDMRGENQTQSGVTKFKTGTKKKSHLADLSDGAIHSVAQ